MPELDVIIVGGGLTGTAIARDAALRGLHTVLVEHKDLGAGASGQVPELLDGGPLGCERPRRRRLQRELEALRTIGGTLVQRRHLLWLAEVNGGLLGAARCATASQVLESGTAHEPWRVVDASTRTLLEPALTVGGGVLVTASWSVLPQRLAVLNARDAEDHGARLCVGWRATDVIREGARVVGLVAVEQRTGRTEALRASVVVNATGAGLQLLAEQLGHRLPLRVVPRIFACLDRRLSHCAVDLGGGLRLLPTPRASWLGPLAQVARSAGLHAPVTPDEMRQLRHAASRWIPAAREAPVISLRVAAQARLGKTEDLRPAAARAPRIVDHADHGCAGMLSVVGGLALEQRWVAQRVVDRIAAGFPQARACTTQVSPLPGGRGRCDEERWVEQYPVAADTIEGLVQRHGSATHDLLQQTEGLDRGATLVCRCAGITLAELRHAADHEHVNHLADLLRRTEAGHGACLGARCLDRCARIWRAVGERSVVEMQQELAEVLRQRVVELGPHLTDTQVESLNLGWAGVISEPSGEADPETTGEPK
ncbi:MAG: FAD-dependent oxidoreductase [Pseudomonadota bacterium]